MCGSYFGCSLGFEVNRTTHSGDWMLSAGHCFESFGSGTPMYHMTWRWGEKRLAEYGGSRDFLLLKVDDVAFSEPKVLHGSLKRDVVGTYLVFTEGASRCQTGAKTNMTVCGTILDSSWSGCYSDGKCMNNLVRATMNPEKGDSGAPVYRFPSSPNYAIYANGILSGGSDTETSYAKWTQIPDSWDVVVSTN
jgi:hypothetical protein